MARLPYFRGAPNPPAPGRGGRPNLTEGVDADPRVNVSRISAHDCRSLSAFTAAPIHREFSGANHRGPPTTSPASKAIPHSHAAM